MSKKTENLNENDFENADDYLDHLFNNPKKKKNTNTQISENIEDEEEENNNETENGETTNNDKKVKKEIVDAGERKMKDRNIKQKRKNDRKNKQSKYDNDY